MKVIAMIPARMGSERLPNKNLQEIGGFSLIEWAIMRCVESGAFDEIWLNTEELGLESVSQSYGIGFHPRPKELATNLSTSEDFVKEFLESHKCDFVVQVHTITPLLTPIEIKNFVDQVRMDSADTFLSGKNEILECIYEDVPVNFNFSQKTNSQDLRPVFQVSWSISAWRRSLFLENKSSSQCSTFSGRIEKIAASNAAGLAIKTRSDLEYARALFDLVYPGGGQ